MPCRGLGDGLSGLGLGLRPRTFDEKDVLPFLPQKGPNPLFIYRRICLPRFLPCRKNSFAKSKLPLYRHWWLSSMLATVFDPFPYFFQFPYIGPVHTTHKINLFCHNVISSLTCDNYREEHEDVTYAICSCLVIEETWRGVAWVKPT